MFTISGRRSPSGPEHPHFFRPETDRRRIDGTAVGSFASSSLQEAQRLLRWRWVNYEIPAMWPPPVMLVGLDSPQ